MDISGVVNIGGTDFKPTGIGTLKWSWKYYEGKSHTHRLECAFYLPDPPVYKIISADFSDKYDEIIL